MAGIGLSDAAIDQLVRDGVLGQSIDPPNEPSRKA